MTKKVAIGLAAFLLIAAIGAASWRRHVAFVDLVEETYYGRMEGLKIGVVKFHDAKGRMPASLAEIVAAGLLPAESVIYVDPMAHGTDRSPAISWKACEFELQFGPKEATISIPRAVFDQKRFASLVDERTRVVSDRVKMYDPAKAP